MKVVVVVERVDIPVGVPCAEAVFDFFNAGFLFGARGVDAVQGVLEILEVGVLGEAVGVITTDDHQAAVFFAVRSFRFDVFVNQVELLADDEKIDTLSTLPKGVVNAHSTSFTNQIG